MIVNSLDRYVDGFLKSPDTFRKEVVSRVVAVAVAILMPVEALCRIGIGVVGIAGYVISRPFVFCHRIYKMIQDPTYATLSLVLAPEEKDMDNYVLKPIALAVSAIANCVLSPLVAPFSPRALLQLHIDCGLATRPVAPSPPKVPLSEPVLDDVNADVAKNIEEKFLRYHQDAEFIAELKNNQVVAPLCLALHGPSNAANRRAAIYTVVKLGKTVRFANIELIRQPFTFLEKLNKNTDVCYIDLTDVKDGKIVDFPVKEILSRLEGAGVVYILNSKVPLDKYNVASRVQIEVPLPDAKLRDKVLHKGLNANLLEDGFDFEAIIAATEGFKVKKIGRFITDLKLEAIQQKKKIDTKRALELVAIAKGKNGAAIPKVVVPNDYVGMEELHKKFDNYLNVLKDPEGAKDYGVKLPAGMILYGPPGCGKTYTAKNLCTYAKSHGVQLNYREVKGSDIASKWKGEGVKKIHQEFEEAKICAPTLLFIDECEGVFPSRERMHDTLSVERTQELDEMLQMIEEAKYHNIIVVGATNHLSSIDSAILRTGRFDYTFQLTAPDAKTRLKMFEAKLKIRKCEPDIDLSALVEASEGFTASDIEVIVNDAAGISWSQRKPISKEILMDSLESVKNKRASVSQKPGDKLAQAPLMQDLKKGMDALKQFLGNLNSYSPQVSNANQGAE